MDSVRSPSMPPPELLVDYQSPHGLEVTHIRGVLLVNALQNLRGWGLYPRYEELMPPESLAIISSTIASSWVPMEIAMQYYGVVDALGVSDYQLQQAGEALAQRIVDTFLRSTLRSGRKEGFESFVAMLTQHNPRLWERMYQGGGFRLTRYGASELGLEDRGNPLDTFRMIRVGYQAYMKTLAQLYCDQLNVTQEAPRASDPQRLATRFRF